MHLWMIGCCVLKVCACDLHVLFPTTIQWNLVNPDNSVPSKMFCSLRKRVIGISLRVVSNGSYLYDDLTDICQFWKQIILSIIVLTCMKWLSFQRHSTILFDHVYFVLSVAAAIKELRQTVLTFMACMVRHYTMISISQQCGKYATSQQNIPLYTCFEIFELLRFGGFFWTFVIFEHLRFLGCFCEL